MPRAGRAAKIPKNVFQDADTWCFCFSFNTYKEIGLSALKVQKS